MKADFTADDFEVIVCDNAGDADTEAVCEKFSGAMQIEYFVEKQPGKNNALNSGLSRAQGELVLFTDDDVLVDRDWLAAMWTAAGDYPHHNVFGGRVVADWPAGFPEHLRESQYRGVCFSVVDLNRGTGPDPDFSPFGTNIGIRRSVFDSGIRYNTEVGPSQHSYIMGSETSLVLELGARGDVPVYVHGSSVTHRIRPDQGSLRWLLGRGVKYGRMIAYRDAESAQAEGRPVPFPRWLIKEIAGGFLVSSFRFLTGRKSDGFDAGFGAAIAWGKLRQHRVGA